MFIYLALEHKKTLHSHFKDKKKSILIFIFHFWTAQTEADVLHLYLSEAAQCH